MQVFLCILLSAVCYHRYAQALQFSTPWTKTSAVKKDVLHLNTLRKLGSSAPWSWFQRTEQASGRFRDSSNQRLHMSVTVCPTKVESTQALQLRSLPKHKNIVEGKLANGLTYIILPNAVPAGRFEAHLEVMSGSANELDNQQGMAHLLEHVAYMGSPKRQLISGTGSRTNAYTDFHHTVFFAACPVQTPEQFWKRPMLPMALDALLDVMTTTVDDDRLEKERAAVLSEASMVNKMEYRVECQILSSLHSENRISTRFPIGKEHLIRSWTKEDLQLYHDTHYRPDNAILFVVGDVEVQNTIDTIQQKFGSLRPKMDSRKFLRETGEFPEVSMRDVSQHFPPVTHQWSCSAQETAHFVPGSLVKPKHKGGVSAPLIPSTRTVNGVDGSDSKSTPTMVPSATLFTHELMQSFSFHLFAKRPIEPIVTENALRRDIMRRMTLSALQIRLNVQQRQDPLFTFVDFNQLNWPREGCAVCSLDMTTDTTFWREAVMLAVREIRRLGLYGLTESELRRYKQATLGEVAQIAAQCDQASNEGVLTELMEAEACGHTYMHAQDRYATTAALLEGITLQDVNSIARELCEHLSHTDPSKGVVPAAVVACAPVVDRTGAAFAISDDDIAGAVQEALLSPLEPLTDTIVPDTLLTPAQLREKARLTPPAFAPLQAKKVGLPSGGLESAMNSMFGGGKGAGDSKVSGLGVLQRQLRNGIKVNMKSLDAEPQRVSMRLYVPGGRLLESKSTPGAVLLGARSMQEGGAFLEMTREEVELFCIDNQVMVEITTTEEALIFDFQSVTTSPGTSHLQSTRDVGEDSNSQSAPTPASAVTGVDAVMQVAHIILTDFKYETDAFERAKQGFHEQFDSTVKGLETACTESLAYSLTGADARFLVPNHKQIDALDLETARQALLSQLRPSNVEVSICGDLTLPQMEQLVLTYMGTVPPRSAYSRADSVASGASKDHSGSENSLTAAILSANSLTVRTLGREQQLVVYLQDSEERAMGYLAGPAPNSWGYFGSGETIADKFTASPGNTKKENRWKDALFSHAALQILQEIANRRLFSVVREERQLTYDASFTLQPRDILRGSWYTVAVTSSPSQVQAAVRACKEALASLKGSFGIMGDSLQSAKRNLWNKFRTESLSNKFWVEQLSGTQSECVPDKSLRSVAEYETVLNSVSVQDIQFLVDVFQFEEDNMTACVGVTAPQAPQ